MKVSILAVLTDTFDSSSIVNQAEIFSGKMAGICYMKDSYFSEDGSGYDDVEKAKSRFVRVANTGHHSITDHSHITLLFEDIPKMTAMILNSLSMYTTSEKSGRYTIMKSSGDNLKLYDKWRFIFEYMIKEEYGDKFSEIEITKFAQENARYVLSIFDNAVTMSYTVSIRQLSYIVCWCKNYIEEIYPNQEITSFNTKVFKCINDLYNNLIVLNAHSDYIIDNKGRTFDFLARQVGYKIWTANERCSDSYLLKYKVSFADLAHEQRHRTIDYFMCYDGNQNNGFYVPELIRTRYADKYMSEWLSDLESVKDTFPIATKVDVVETGLVSNFMLKCDERLCGRVLLETMNNCMNSLFKFIRECNKSPYMYQQLSRHYDFDIGKVLMKCDNFSCKEPCKFGPICAKTRLI